MPFVTTNGSVPAPCGATCLSALTTGTLFSKATPEATKRGLWVWARVFETLQEPDLEWMIVDSATVRAHQCAAGKKLMPLLRHLVARGGL